MLQSSVKTNHAEALLLSGGLDSSILASILKPAFSLTISLGQNSPDVKPAKVIAAMYSKHHKVIRLSYKRLLNIIEEVIRLFKTFDPMEIRNTSVVLAGIRSAKEQGYSKVMTGDGGDELFAGYNYLKRYYHDIQSLDNQLHRLWESMHFSSLLIGKNMGIDIKTPFLDKDFLAYAKSIGTNKKIGEYNGEKWGKFILRKCYESELGKQIAWRSKLAQEQGAGIVKIKDFISNNIMMNVKVLFQSGMNQALSDNIRIRDREHLYYYTVFRKYFCAPKDELCGDFRCPDCKGCLNSITRFCHTCGAFPIMPI